jgi:hypothetical protein
MSPCVVPRDRFAALRSETTFPHSSTVLASGCSNETGSARIPMTIEQALEAIRKAADDARRVGATEHQIIAAASARQEKTDTVASAGAKVLAGNR